MMEENVMAKSMVVAGVMSGTSADGVDVAVCRISAPRVEGDVPRVKVLGHVGFGYSKAVRGAVLRVMDGETVPAGEMSRLHWRLGEIYAECVGKATEKFGVKVGLVGCHGQTGALMRRWLRSFWELRCGLRGRWVRLV